MAAYVTSSIVGGTVLTMPAGIQSGDDLVVVQGYFASAAAAVNVAGWTQINFGAAESFGGAAAWYRRATGSESGQAYTFPLPQGLSTDVTTGVIVMRGTTGYLGLLRDSLGATASNGTFPRPSHGQAYTVVYAQTYSGSNGGAVYTWGNGATSQNTGASGFSRVQLGNGNEIASGQAPAATYSNGGADQNLQVFAISLAGNLPPTAPTLLAPVGNVTFDRTVTQRFSWTVNDPNAGDSQSRYDLRYRLVGAATWTDVTASVPTAFNDFAGSTFAAGSYEWQVRTYDAQGLVGPYSGSEFFTAATPPAGPTITAPANNSTVSTNSAPLSWSYPTQSAYQVRQLDSADAVIYDSGTVSGTQGQQTRSVTLDFPTNNVTRKLQVRVQDSGTGLWSPYSTVTVTVSYTPPATPTLLVVPSDSTGSISVLVSHPTPTGSQPAVSATEVEVRATTAGDPYRPPGVAVRLSINAPSGILEDAAGASGVDYEYRALAVGSNQTSTYSAWTGAATAQAAGTYGGY